MKKKLLCSVMSALVFTATACGTISPPEQTVTTSVVTDVQTEPTLIGTEEVTQKAEKEQNTFITEFFDSDILFTDPQELVKNSMKGCTFENEIKSENGTQKITLKAENGGGIISVVCIDLSRSSLSYDIEYILENFGDYYFSLTSSQMNGITENDFVSNHRMVSSIVSKGKYQRYATVSKTDSMASQFGYTETYAVLSDNMLMLISGAYLSTDMLERQSFIQLLQTFEKNIIGM